MSALPAVSTNNLPKMGSKKAITAAAKADLAKQKAVAKAQIKAIQEQEKALSSLPGTLTKAESAYEWKNSKDSKFDVESIYPGPHEDWLTNYMEGQAIASLASIAQSALTASQQAQAQVKAEAQLAKAQKAYADTHPSTDSRFDEQGNELLQTNLDQKWCDLMNLLASALNNGAVKVKGKVKVNPVQMSLSKKETHFMGEIIKAGFVSESDEGYIFTDKGLSLYQTTWAEVKKNLAAIL